MTASALVQARIDAELKTRASTVLENMGLTISDAIRILLTRVATEGALPAGLVTDPVAHDAWFRSKVMEALNDPRPPVDGDTVEIRFAQRRAATLQRLNETDR